MTAIPKVPRYHVMAVRLVYRDDTRACDVLRTVGHRAGLGVEWRGPTRRTVMEARQDIAAHKAGDVRRDDEPEAVQAHRETVGR